MCLVLFLINNGWKVLLTLAIFTRNHFYVLRVLSSARPIFLLTQLISVFVLFILSCFYFDFSSHTNEFLRECQGAALLDNDPCRGRSRLNERERRQAALPILTFGNDMVSQQTSIG